MRFIFDNSTEFSIDWTRFRRSQQPTLFQQQKIKPKIARTTEPPVERRLIGYKR